MIYEFPLDYKSLIAPLITYNRTRSDYYVVTDRYRQQWEDDSPRGKLFVFFLNTSWKPLLQFSKLSDDRKIITLPFYLYVCV